MIIIKILKKEEIVKNECFFKEKNYKYLIKYIVSYNIFLKIIIFLEMYIII
jgi:hypothetical protein